MTARNLTPRQQAENRAFIAVLARTGNARLAAELLGVHRATYTKRRAKHPAFAAQWDAALKESQAGLNPPRNGEGNHPQGGGGAARRAESNRQPNPLVLTRLKSGRAQLRRVRPGTITPVSEAAFLTALAASANIRLSAAEAGFAHSSFYTRRRGHPDFARDMDEALETAGYRIEWAAMESALRGTGLVPESPRETGAFESPIPPMTPDQALRLLGYRHRARMTGRAGGRAAKPPSIEQVTEKILRRAEAVKRMRK